MNFSPLCKPSLILTISQPLLCTHQQARTKLGITLCFTVSQQTASFQVFLYSCFFFRFCSQCLFPLWSFGASLVLLMCCLICVLAGFEVAFRACFSLIQDLDVMHTKELEKGTDCVHWSLPALLFFFLTCLHPLPTVVNTDPTMSQKMEGDAFTQMLPGSFFFNKKVRLVSFFITLFLS